MPNTVLTVKNYRGFADDNPLRMDIGSGFTSILGPNNSGKSAILKFPYEARPLLQSFSATSANQVTAFRGERQGISAWASAPGERVLTNVNDRDFEFTVSWLRAPMWSGGDAQSHQVTVSLDRTQGTYSMRMSVGSEQFTPAKVAFQANSQILQGPDGPIADLEPFYSTCQVLADSMYIGPFRNVVNLGGSQNYFDISIGDQFISNFHELKAGETPENNEAVFQLLADIRRIFEFDSFDINASPDRTTLQLFINGRSYRLPELGGGLSHFILVLANVLTRRPSYVLLDEPELNLHSTLQMDFLTTVASYAKEGIIFATHSYGLARATSERIYSVQRLPNGQSEIRPLEATARLAEFVGELGFAGYRELGFEKLLLVEGPSDLTVIQQLLRLYGKEHEIALIHLGGRSSINSKSEPELLELKRITDQIVAVIDSEREQEGASLSDEIAQFKDICDATGIGLHVLERRAIENYFSDNAVKRALGSSFEALQPYEALKESATPWPKRDNWKVAREMTRAEIEETDLHPFLEGL